jgi:S-adenosylmethionine decarboxylase
MYIPGTHLIATLSTNANSKLRIYDDLKTRLDKLIAEFDLHNLGEVYHNFSPEGFTAVICLSESHISLHTWPEHGKINLDIYLSNFKKVNDQTVYKLFHNLVEYFEADIVEQHELKR